MNIAIYAHGGSANHGCEALVRSIIYTLGNKNISYRLLSENAKEDKYYEIDKLVEIISSQDIPYRGWRNFFYKILMKIYKDDKLYYKNIYRNFISKIENADLALAIGGDNYCYHGFLERFGVQNDFLKKAKIPSILLGCSIDPDRINEKVINDLRKYQIITARESITYQALIDKGMNNVHLIPDMAFNLPKIDIVIENIINYDNVVGINISPLITSYEKKSGTTMRNYEQLIEYILNETSLSIMLIPHVVWSHNDDRIPLKLLYNKYCNSKRIILLDDHNACELKGAISKCRFLIAARTHASIAGYSTGVPTLVVGYSVKSKGIATDIFGTDKNYVIPISDFNDEDRLKNSFMWLMNNEQKIKYHYSKIIPDYIKQVNKYKDIIYNIKM